MKHQQTERAGFPSFPAVMAGAALLAAAAVILLLAWSTIGAFRGRWLVLFLPAVLFAGIAVFVRCGVFSERAGNWVTGLLILPLAAGGVILSLLSAVSAGRVGVLRFLPHPRSCTFSRRTGRTCLYRTTERCVFCGFRRTEPPLFTQAAGKTSGGFRVSGSVNNL